MALAIPRIPNEDLLLPPEQDVPTFFEECRLQNEHLLKNFDILSDCCVEDLYLTTDGVVR